MVAIRVGYRITVYALAAVLLLLPQRSPDAVAISLLLMLGIVGGDIAAIRFVPPRTACPTIVSALLSLVVAGGVTIDPALGILVLVPVFEVARGVTGGVFDTLERHPGRASPVSTAADQARADGTARRSSPVSAASGETRREPPARRAHLVAIAASAAATVVALVVLTSAAAGDLLAERPAESGGASLPVAAFAGGWAAAVAGAVAAGTGIEVAERREREYRARYDEERRTRYALEQARAKLARAGREQVQNAELRERNRISRSLHDSVGHRLSGVLLQLEAAGKAESAGGHDVRPIYARAREALRETITLLRDTVYEMRPRQIDPDVELRAVIDRFTFCPVDWSVEGGLGGLSDAHREALTVSLEEALTNVARHSSASRVEVSISITASMARLLVENDGGPPERTRVHREGMGLSGMRERATALGGSFAVTPGNRFRVVLVLPRERAAVGQSAGIDESREGSSRSAATPKEEDRG